MLHKQQITANQFDALVQQPENRETRFELIGGEIVRVPSNSFVSAIAAQIIFLIKRFLYERGIKGHVTGEGGGYQIAGERYAPDVAYMPVTKQPELDKDGYNSVPPDLAVEVVSSARGDELDRLRIKITNYHAEGVVVWVVKPDEKQVEVHAPGQRVSIYRADDTLPGGDVLPELRLRVRDIFEF